MKKILMEENWNNEEENIRNWRRRILVEIK